MIRAPVIAIWSFVIVASFKSVSGLEAVEEADERAPAAMLAARPEGGEATAPKAKAALRPEATEVMPRLPSAPRSFSIARSTRLRAALSLQPRARPTS